MPKTASGNESNAWSEQQLQRLRGREEGRLEEEQMGQGESGEGRGEREEWRGEREVGRVESGEGLGFRL